MFAPPSVSTLNPWLLFWTLLPWTSRPDVPARTELTVGVSAPEAAFRLITPGTPVAPRVIAPPFST